jgi:hypothetical protein
VCAQPVPAAAPEESDAVVALDRWGALENAAERERRFRRRAFERARDRALITLAMARPARRHDTLVA